MMPSNTVENLINWYDVLEKYRIASWQLQRLITHPQQELVAAEWDSAKQPPKGRGRPEAPLTEPEFVTILGEPEDVFFNSLILENYMKEHSRLIDQPEDRSNGKEDCDWSECLSWSELVDQWGFVDEFMLFERFFVSDAKLEACSWNSEKDCPEKRISEIGYALRSTPDLCDVKFCRKHVQVYEEANYRNLPHGVFLEKQHNKSTASPLEKTVNSGNVKSDPACTGPCLRPSERPCFDPKKFDLIVKEVFEESRPGYLTLVSKNGLRETPKELIPRSEEMTEIYKQADRFAKSDASILILGPTGSGKSHLAEYIHSHSSRSDGPFCPMNCAYLTSELSVLSTVWT